MKSVIGLGDTVEKNTALLNWEEEVIALRSFPRFLQLCAIRFEETDVRSLHETYEVYCAKCQTIVSNHALEELLKYIVMFECSGDLLKLEQFQTGDEFGEVFCAVCGHEFVEIHFDPYVADPDAYDLPAFENLMKSLD